jgi:hypothetical protein
VTVIWDMPTAVKSCRQSLHQTDTVLKVMHTNTSNMFIGRQSGVC